MSELRAQVVVSEELGSSMMKSTVVHAYLIFSVECVQLPHSSTMMQNRLSRRGKSLRYEGSGNGGNVR